MKKYLIRRAIVYSLYRYSSPKSLNEILSSENIISLENCDAAFLRREWAYLVDVEILVPVQGFVEYCTLSDSIREKLNDGLSLCDNEFLYGPAAIGFKAQENELRKLLSNENNQKGM